MTLENDAGKPQIGACPLVKEPRGKRGVLFHAPSYDFGYPAIANPLELFLPGQGASCGSPNPKEGS